MIPKTFVTKMERYRANLVVIGNIILRTRGVNIPQSEIHIEGW